MGLGAENPKFHTKIDIDLLLAAHTHRIIASRGSVPNHGTVEVRGMTVDVDAVATRHRGWEIETDAFWRWL